MATWHTLNQPQCPPYGRNSLLSSFPDKFTPLFGCTSFGYMYHVPSGLCITANAASSTYPLYEGGAITLQPCDACSSTGPPVNQTFCTDMYTQGKYSPYQCMFFGDTTLSDSCYGANYEAGPGSSVFTLQISGECIFLLFWPSQDGHSD